MGDLKQNERIVWQNIKDGPFPSNVLEIIENIATTFLPPIKTEELSIEVLKQNGRILHPTESYNIRESTNQEIAKRSRFQSVLRNVIEMWTFFQQMLGDGAAFQLYVQAGCYTPKFCSVLLERIHLKRK